MKRWTKQECLEEALKYNTKTQFIKNSINAYWSACKYKWIDEICSHMIQLRIPKNSITKEQCHEEALKFKTRSNFYKESSNIYQIATRNNWLDEICSHMKIKLTKELCKQIALQYNTKSELRNNNCNVYNTIYKKKWVDELCSHMKGIKPKNYWIKEKCKEESLKYKTKTEFSKNEFQAYWLACKNKWLDEFYPIKNKESKEKKEKCIKEALKYNTKTEFNKNSPNIYGLARRNKWLNEICSHMIK